MTAEERDELISWLVMWTGWQRSAFESKGNRELLRLADRYRNL